MRDECWLYIHGAGTSGVATRRTQAPAWDTHKPCDFIPYIEKCIGGSYDSKQYVLYDIQQHPDYLFVKGAIPEPSALGMINLRYEVMQGCCFLHCQCHCRNGACFGL